MIAGRHNVLRKNSLVLVLLLLLGFAAACDAGLEIVGLEIVKYPDKITYIAGVDTKLDLYGGKVEYICLDKNVGGSPVSMYSEFITVSHNIDFTKPGVYVVTLTQHKGMCKFPVQVIGKDYINKLQDKK